MKRITYALALVTLVFGWGLTQLALADSDADSDSGRANQTECLYCQMVDKISSRIRCAKCMHAAKQCPSCARIAAKVRKTAGCEMCLEGKEAQCTACRAANEKLEHAKCAFCAAKKMIAAHVACCGKCAKKDEAARAQCKGCQQVREAVLAVKCESCAAKQK